MNPRSRFPKLRPARLGSLPRGPLEELRFVQDRVALLGKLTFYISSMFLVAVAAADSVRHVQRLQPAGRLSHTVGTLIALAMWLTLRGRRTLAERTLLGLDVLGTVGICASFIGMGSFAVQPYGYYTAMLAVTHVCVTRAMVVPSEPGRTFLVSVASFAGFMVMRSTLPLTPDMIVLGGRGRALVEAFLWSAAGIAISTVASKVIYGLQKRAKEALQLGQYALEEKIGEGGMGEIYRASHAMLRRPTAIKLLRGDGTESELRRFEKEVQLTARLTHPNTISIFDYGRTPDGIFYYAMELLEGVTLEQLVEHYGPLPPGRAIHLLLQVCGALNEAHHIGLIHRDIKPANLFLCRRGEIADFVKVLDFGLVRELRSPGDTTQSNLNVVVGTPLFISPESILEPDQVDALADVYGLGAVAYFLLTGAVPFRGKNLVEVCAHHLHTVPPPPSTHTPVPADLERVVLACLEKSRAARPPSAHALSEQLQACADAGTWRAEDAERWWAAATLPPRGSPSSSTFTLDGDSRMRRTIVAADLEERLAAELRRA